VLLNGRQIESGRTAAIFENPRRRYTSALIQSVPLPEVDRNWLNTTEDETNEFNREQAMNISGSVALVTGSNRGIGRCLVKALVDQGAKKVYASARDASTVEDLESLYPGVVQGIGLDVTEASSVAEAALNCNDVDILINNAGVNRTRGLIAANDLKGAREEMETNYFGTLNMCRAFAPVLKVNGGGCIVNMLSILSRVALPLMGSLCASKAAALRLTEGVRAELNAQNTLVTAVMPGAVDTDMSKDFPPPKMAPEEVAEAVLAAIKEGAEETYPGDMASGLCQGLANDPKGVEKELAGYLPA
jgi:NAD(P)-dependent dehydrogenase (short-subunit alcohol dehydrogenase family)